MLPVATHTSVEPAKIDKTLIFTTQDHNDNIFTKKRRMMAGCDK